MRTLIDTFRFCLVIFVGVMSGGLIYQGVDSVFYYKQLQLSRTTPTEILNKLNGCRVVYHTCEIKVVGSEPRHVAGKFNGVIIPDNKQPYKF